MPLSRQRPRTARLPLLLSLLVTGGCFSDDDAGPDSGHDGSPPTNDIAADTTHDAGNAEASSTPADGNTNGDSTIPTPDATISQTLTVHLRKPAGWGAAHVHYWQSEPDRLQTSWPGLPLTDEGDGWYGLTLTGQQSAGLVFSDAGGAQTVDLARLGEGWFVPTGVGHGGRLVGRWYDRHPDRFPRVSAAPPGGNIYAEKLAVTLLADGAPATTRRYTLDGSDPAQGGKSFAPGELIELGAGLAVGNSVTLRLHAVTSHGTDETSLIFTRRKARTVEAWDPSDKPAKVIASGRYVMLEQFNNDQGLAPRNVKLMLPADYHTSTRRYRVIYFHDGQNLYDAAESALGDEWMVDEFHDELTAEGAIEPAIVVGIWNAGADRTREYVGSPTDGDAKPAYTAWLIHSLKPYVDHHYRTLPQAEHTANIGSSFGGAIAVYQSWSHPEIFGAAGCVSGSFKHNALSLLQSIEAYQGPQKALRYWIDAGTDEVEKEPTGRGWLLAQNRRLAEKLAALGWEEGDDLGYLEAEGEDHSERAWARRIKKILHFLLRRRAPRLIRTETRVSRETLAPGEAAYASVDLLYEDDFALTKVFADATPPLSLISSAPAVLAVDPVDGQLSAMGPGVASVEVALSGKQSSALVNVQ